MGMGEGPKPPGYKKMEAAEKKLEMKAKEDMIRKIVRQELRAVKKPVAKKVAKKIAKKK